MKRVSAFAKEKGISRGRAYALVRSGAIPAEVLDGGAIMLDDMAMAWQPRAARPLSERMAWFLLAALEGRRAEGARDAERARIRKHLAELQAAPESARLLAGKVAARAALREFSAHKADVADLRADPRLRLSGVGAPGSGMVADDVVEGYVCADVLDGLVNDYLLQEGRGNNVRLRVDTDHEVGKAALAADLADWGRARELREANRILHELLQELR
ncbi:MULTISPECIES: hypothetical protein [unclassified Leucobacter]|uniref:hypothetical protein n=1 Tax=unclassified Leucobacter TaxID=2621730 RepID=UPI00301B01D4